MVYEADEYPLDEDAMIVLMDMAGWTYAVVDGRHTLSSAGAEYRVPADEHGKTVTNAFKMFLWLTNKHRSK
jgi:hypothetical protein